MSRPENARYSKTHEWALLEGDVLTMGVTDFAVEHLGDIVYILFKVSIKILKHFLPVEITFCNSVEFFLYTSRKVVIHDLPKVLSEKIRHQHAHITWKKSIRCCTCVLGLNRGLDAAVLETKDPEFSWLARA